MNPTQDRAAPPSLADVARRAAAVRQPGQFHAWLDEAVQALLPHRLLACGRYDPRQGRLLFTVFGNSWLPARVIGTLADERGALAVELVSRWLAGPDRAAEVPLASLGDHCNAALQAIVTEAGVTRLLCHGVRFAADDGSPETFFVLGDDGRQHIEGLLDAFELLLPWLHLAWRRAAFGASPREAASHGLLPAVAAESTPLVEAPHTRGSVVTIREREILAGVRDGKSNREIAETLRLSPLTVKNHIQKVLRKLDANNRAQAVGLALAAGLLAPAAPAEGEVSRLPS